MRPIQIDINFSILFLLWVLLVIFSNPSIFVKTSPEHGIPENTVVYPSIPDENLNLTRGDIINLCQNKTLQDTSECLVKFTKTFFIYNLTDDSINLTFSDLKIRGGDCRDWAYYYEGLGKDLGFQGSTALFVTTPKETSHRIAILSDNTGYCTIDQRSYSCKTLNSRLKNDTNRDN